MKGIQYLILLRGINVGGNNVIKMIDLKSCLENAGFSDIATYIQSGNVLINSEEKDKTKLTNKIENLLSKKFNYNSRIAIITYQQLKNIVQKAPEGFGSKPEKFRYNVIFLKEPLSAKEAIKQVSIKEGVDNAYSGKNVLYFSLLISKATQSRITRIISLPIYQYITIRNWNTTTKLFSLMEEKENNT